MASMRHVFAALGMLALIACNSGAPPEATKLPATPGMGPEAKAPAPRVAPRPRPPRSAPARRDTKIAGEMRHLLRTFNEAKRRRRRGDVAGVKRAAKVIEATARKLAGKKGSATQDRSYALLRSRAALLVKFADPVRFGALRAACVSCHRQRGLGSILPRR